ncbi:MAG: LPS assembly lipoprotein LptE [Syntrophobacterales bacterium]|jgi:hypothetical protein|nr:LPS assembly lipoprotein LptE [Syntrophobacterales bacterium]
MKELNRRLGWIFLMAVVLLSVCSCGYQMVGLGGRGIYGGDITSLSMGPFKNITYEPHASLYVTDTFSQEVLSAGLFDLNRPDADSHLQGIIKQILIRPSSMSAQGIVIQKTATIDVELVLSKRDGTFIKRWFFSDSEPYNTNDIQAEDFNKRNAFQTISARMARKFIAALLVDY